MIPEWLVAFVHGPVLSFVGARDERLRPSLSWAFGARVAAASDELTAFVPDVEAGPVMRDARQNARIAYTVVEPLSHEAYQFKGTLVSLRPSTEEERAVQEILRSKIVARLTMFPRALPEGYRLWPSTALTFRVEQAFIQTPGPEAGKALELSAPAA